MTPMAAGAEMTVFGPELLLRLAGFFVVSLVIGGLTGWAIGHRVHKPERVFVEGIFGGVTGGLFLLILSPLKVFWADLVIGSFAGALLPGSVEVLVYIVERREARKFRESGHDNSRS